MENEIISKTHAMWLGKAVFDLNNDQATSPMGERKILYLLWILERYDSLPGTYRDLVDAGPVSHATVSSMTPALVRHGLLKKNGNSYSLVFDW